MASNEEQKEQKVGLTITVRLQDGTQTSFKARRRARDAPRRAGGAADAARTPPTARR